MWVCKVAELLQHVNFSFEVIFILGMETLDGEGADA